VGKIAEEEVECRKVGKEDLEDLITVMEKEGLTRATAATLQRVGCIS
jgi:hypothetical protein